jgi:hypothetical protein
MRNFSAFQRRLPRPARIFVTFLFNNHGDVRDRLHGEAHLDGARGYGTCLAMDQSLILGCPQSSGESSGMMSVITERPRTARGSMLVTNQDSVNCVREHAVVTGI